ncbi:MAG: NAD(P)H:quinone oxidoreductase [Gammaproteobacteria bacterium]
MTQDILVLYYSELGGTQALAEAIAAGIESVPGAAARIRTVPALYTAQESAPAPTGPGPMFVTHQDLEECIGLALGSPTRFGNMAAPLKYFWDTTTGPWSTGVLVNKPACVFTTAASQHAGHESTLLSMMIPLLHHGMILLGCPYTEPALNQTQTGGTPYGPSHYSGVQSNLPLSVEEKTIAFSVGKRLAKIALKLLEITEK